MNKNALTCRAAALWTRAAIIAARNAKKAPAKAKPIATADTRIAAPKPEIFWRSKQMPRVREEYTKLANINLSETFKK